MTLNNIMIVTADIYSGVVNFLFTLVLYSYIITSIPGTCQVWVSGGHFSTCSSHLLVATWYHSTIIHLPGFNSSMENGKVVPVLDKTISPTLDPLIYSLWNKDVNVALNKVFSYI